MCHPEGPQLLRFGAQTLVDPPEYFCNHCGAIRMWTGKPEHKYDKCVFCLSPDLTWFTANHPDLFVLQRTWFENRAAVNAALLATIQDIISTHEESK